MLLSPSSPLVLLTWARFWALPGLHSCWRQRAGLQPLTPRGVTGAALPFSSFSAPLSHVDACSGAFRKEGVGFAPLGDTCRVGV